jgi:hypothetical protein
MTVNLSACFSGSNDNNHHISANSVKAMCFPLLRKRNDIGGAFQLCHFNTAGTNLLWKSTAALRD